MDWRQRYADKFTTAEAAAAQVSAGDWVWVGMVNSVPQTYSRALYARKGELRDVKIFGHLVPFNWVGEESREAFRFVTAFTTAIDRGAVQAGIADYMPLANFNRSHLLASHPRMDIGVATMSPPDDNGYLSFGPALWANQTMHMASKRWFAEIDERYIRTYGNNYIHISQIEGIFDHDESHDIQLPIPPRNQEVEDAANVICTLVAEELVKDGDCLQMGIGDVSAALPVFLENRHDLGLQTEMIGGGVMEMIERGVINGSKKQIATGKAVGSAFAQAPPEEITKAHMNPALELWDFCDTDDLRILIQNDNFKAINNALQVDLTGQVTAETLNSRVFSGPGGQTIFSIAASYSEGGASIVVLPSSSVVNGERVSRFVPTFPSGTMVTVPRTFVDYVVTEQGIAKLSGKTVRERVDELVSIAHPDFRADLRKQAALLYGV